MKLNFVLALGAVILLLSACSNPLATDSASRGPATPEPAYMGKAGVSYGGTFQVKATAKFKYRPTKSSGGAWGLYAPDAGSIAEIAFAEFQVFDSSGTMVQAGETDTDGVALFDMPQTAGTYTLKVYSRAQNNKLNISVLEDIYYNSPYSISKSFTLTAGTFGSALYDIGTMTAEAEESKSSKIEGAAFNIYYDILMANDYIRSEIGNAAWVASKVTVYWKAGFNPYTYYDQSAPLSFYVPGERKLYILGGSNGNVKTQDTDHFDDSVILHEYGHFLEDVYGHTDSPGGSHNGNFIIDPRLAWSEGWANYFQSAVLSSTDAVPASPNHRPRIYIDTYGWKTSSADATAGANIAVDMNDGGGTALYDRSVVLGEGEFREMSIARTLYKSSRNPASTVGGALSGGGIPFSKYWETFATGATSLRQTSTYPTPSAGLFLKLLKINYTGSETNLNAILTDEGQRSDTQEYAQEVDWTAVACSRNIQGTAEKYPSGSSLSRSDQLRNNDFFLYYYDGLPTSSTISLAYTPTKASNNLTWMDLDIIVYKVSYIFQEDYYYHSGQSSSYIVTQRRRETGTEPTCSYDATKNCEEVSLSGKSAGWYMVNVKVHAWEKNSQGQYQQRLSNQVDGVTPYSLRNSAGDKYLCP
ncbi:hypothetical protein [Bdellovibrio sp. HCB2-146]|uniref:hypothetical protein n=1 Tax=Bdellovibrio sp. HCB2-146 TaxID=3394362 RepID=UPI0039BC8D70